MSDIRDDEALIMKLAERLHSKMEHLDPTDKPDWNRLSERDKDFYRICVEDLVVGLHIEGLHVVPRS